MSKWNTIHDFFRGWGLQEQLPDNEEILEDPEGILKDHPDTDISLRWRMIRHKQPERFIWADDAERLLKTNIFDDGADLEDIYVRLLSLLAAEAEEQRKYCEAHPVRLPTHLTIPKYTGSQPLQFLYLRKVLTEDSLIDDRAAD